MQKIIVAGLLFLTSLSGADLLTGDTKLSCEAILCLSTSSRPGECSPSISKYFSIHKRKMSDTIKARKNFLKLCPTGSKDREFIKLRDDILPRITGGCSPEELNARINTKREQERIYDSRINDYVTVYIKKYQVNPFLTHSCKLLKSSKYTDINVVYTCNSNKFYNDDSWKRGFEINPISKSQYDNLPSNERYIDNSYTASRNFFNKQKTYYQKKLINKKCWVLGK